MITNDTGGKNSGEIFLKLMMNNYGSVLVVAVFFVSLSNGLFPIHIKGRRGEIRSRLKYFVNNIDKKL